MFRRSLFPLLLFGLLMVEACTPARTVFWNLPGQNDQRKFPVKQIKRSGEVYPLHEMCEAGIPPIEEWGISSPFESGMDEETFFRKTNTMAFLVLRNDTLLYEYYDKHHSPATPLTSFSMVKAYVSTLVGIAISEGHIDSVTQCASDFLPELKKEGLDKITILNLLQMCSGIKTSESLANPFGTSVRMYYSRKLDRVMRNLKTYTTPGSKYKYQNINTQLLARVLEKATGRDIATYLQEKIWVPLGMESDAAWSLDRRDGEIKAFCCLSAVARDFARFGILIADSGRWQGKQIVPEQWIKMLMSPTIQGITLPRYRMHWYTSAEHHDIYAEGLLGQFTYICPSTKTVIIRMGQGLQVNVKWYSMFKFLAGLEDKPMQQEVPVEQLKSYEGVYVFGPSNDNDSAMYGKKATVVATKEGLRIDTDMYDPFLAWPAGDNTFYNVKNSRKLHFYKDSTGQFIRINWYRRGVSWELDRQR